MSQNTSSTERQPMRAVVAAIVLATDLPMPDTIRFHVYPDGKGILSMNLDNVADGQEWSRRLGGETDTYVNKENGHRYLSEGLINWRGWRVQIHASEPVGDDQLDSDTTAALAAIAEVKP